jgi:3-oxoacyl-[acyl-carrier-protein] synthase III
MNCTVRGVRVVGIASAVPPAVITPLQTAGPAGVSPEEAQKIAQMTGVQQRRVADPSCCTSDMAYAAARRLLDDLKWDLDSVDALVFVSQTHDYDLPATACILQHRLGLSSHCAAFDISLGCSGYVYGLWVCANLAAGGAKRVLLLVGDTTSRVCSPQDRSTAFLFGDAGTATALEQDPSAPDMAFVLGTDGSGEKFLYLPDSGFRQKEAEENSGLPPGDILVRGPLAIYMDGSEVFSFTLRRVPSMIKDVLATAGWTLDEVDAVVPHQANLFMLKHLAKRIGIPVEKLVISLDEFGNTSSASIPLALNHRMTQRLTQAPSKLILAGFGVGWSWGAVALTCGPLVMPEIIYMEEPAVQATA